MKTVTSQLSELNWRTYLNENFGPATYSIIYLYNDQVSQINEICSGHLPKVLLEQIAKHREILWVGTEREYRRINDL